MDIYSSIRECKGIGEKTEKSFQKLGVYSVLDMLLHFPRTFKAYPEISGPEELAAGKTLAVKGHLVGRPILRKTARMDLVTAVVSDGLNELRLVWFRQSYMAKTLLEESEFIFYGKVIFKAGAFTMEQAEVFTIGKYLTLMNQMQPVYSLTKGIKNNQVAKCAKAVLDEGIYPHEILSEESLRKYNFPNPKNAYYSMHFPESLEAYDLARKKFAYEEFFLFMLGMKYQKAHLAEVKNEFVILDFSIIDRVTSELPYELTEGQKGALDDLKRDVSGESCMQRLVQGDVGSGKTIVAFLMMLCFADNGYQAAIMAPTEVLAVQHYEGLKKLISQYGLDFQVVLLTGSMKASEKKAARKILEECPNALAVGTHALIQDKVNFANLGLVVTDEQHRFGVRQRDAFSDKGNHPHIMVMSATPIPRTLAIILYGDLDISLMMGLPSKRLPIKNCVVGEKSHPAAYKMIYQEIQAGHQAYVICPLVEESEGLEAKDVVSYGKELQELFPDTVNVAVLHGKMKQAEKNQIMEAFGRNEIQILVSTTVIEVGIDVPNATVIMIENAERFGLAQLHQLRGRVGRGSAQSYCILINGSDGKDAKARLEILNQSNDGFFIANEDLRLRGPGEYFGLRQSGELNFRVGDIYRDQMLLKSASSDVDQLLDSDPDLSHREHGELKNRVLSFMREREEAAGL